MDYDTLDKKIWGPHYWFVIHCYAHHYSDDPSEDEQEIAKLFLKILPFILPCGECSVHAVRYIRHFYSMINDIVKTKQTLKDFFYNFHNNVTKRISIEN